MKSFARNDMMQVKILFFGQLTDATGVSELVLDKPSDTNALIQQLNALYPGLASKKYLVAVNARTIAENTMLEDNSTIALLPPFSGG